MAYKLRLFNKSVLPVGLLLLLTACSDKTNSERAVFEALDESLTSSNLAISYSSASIYLSLENKLAEPASAERAGIWYPRAKQVKYFSDRMIAYIDSLKIELKKEAGHDNESKSFGKNDRKAVSRLFKVKGIGEELYENLRRYKENILRIDPLITAQFDKTIILTTQSFDSDKQQEFTNTFFDNIQTAAALAILNKFQNNIKLTEYKVSAFCNEQMTNHHPYFDFYSAIIGQNSTYIRMGEKIEITAGVGAFNIEAKPEITINGKNIDINEEGVAIYKLKATGKPEKHFIPVKINFTDQYGKKQTIEKDVEYTVIKEIATDK